MDRIDKRPALEAAELAGEILLESGAEIFRVEETIAHITKAYQVESADAFVLSSGIFLTAGNPREKGYSKVRHIPLSGTRLDRVAAVNQLSREITLGQHSPAQAVVRLREIQAMPKKSRLLQILASGVGSGSFCILFGGDWADMLVALVAGVLVYAYLLCVVRGRLSKIITNLSASALVTLFSLLLYRLGLGHQLDVIVIGSIIPLVPGVAFVTAIRDIADQDYIAGMVRMLDALLVTFCIALGVGLSISLFQAIGGGVLL